MSLSNKELMGRMMELEARVEYLTRIVNMTAGNGLSIEHHKLAINEAIQSVKENYPDFDGKFEVEINGQKQTGTLRVIKD